MSSHKETTIRSTGRHQPPPSGEIVCFRPESSTAEVEPALLNCWAEPTWKVWGRPGANEELPDANHVGRRQIPSSFLSKWPPRQRTHFSRSDRCAGVSWRPAYPVRLGPQGTQAPSPSIPKEAVPSLRCGGITELLLVGRVRGAAPAGRRRPGRRLRGIAAYFLMAIHTDLVLPSCSVAFSSQVPALYGLPFVLRLKCHSTPVRRN
jgi:hypothetical protein